ncbi:MAG: NepR family anti-sigma factor [Methylocystis sp.]|uniref:NepR family anti-sigma factor n=1 Tax=Methylocystis sp. TaxID=1911079 RepID=UPI003920D62F
MSPHENCAIRNQPATRGNRVQREGLDLERTTMRLGDQLRRQFSDVASEPLPADMLALLEQLNTAVNKQGQRST